ncbi:MAG: ABC transporter ATP-binding protein [Dehalococcoidales bacterium]|nr:ABC transporter ATP-binding protein [Dehalococcoidales bacterium]
MLEVSKLTRNFGGLVAVSDVDFKIQRGEIVGLIGPNGAGKTTVFNLITGFLKPTRGKVIFNGTDITGKNPHQVARSGLVRTFQGNHIFPNESVLDNIITAGYLNAKMRLAEALFHTPGSCRKEEKVLKKALEISEFLGLVDVRNTLAKNLPHGFKRTLGIGIALAVEPELLLLDEPLSGMNAGEVDKAMVLIRRVWERGITVLLIEHNMRAAMNLCQRIVVLEMGKKICEGSPTDVTCNQRVIEAYLGVGSNVTKTQ